MTEKKKTILDYSKKLGISIEEATQLWEDDQNDYITEEGEEMTVKAKAVKNVAISDKRKKTKKVRKVDAEKLEILTEIAELLTELGYNAEIEKEIAIHFGDYSLKLTRHRPQK